MFRKNVAAAIAAAALGSAALAVPASAAPIDSVLMNTAGNTFQFGDVNACAPGAAPAAGGILDWNENGGQTTVEPTLDGEICLQNTNATARIVLELYDNNHDVVTRERSPSLSGSGGLLDTSAVSLAAPQVSSSVVDHTHAVLQRWSGGTWVPVFTSALNYP
jgi:hypothetical protein